MKYYKKIIKEYPIENAVKTLNLSYRQLGEKTGIHYTYWQKVLSRGLIVPEEMATKMCKEIEKLQRPNANKS